MNVYEYERIVAAGVLDDERVELVDGYVVRRMPNNPPHSWSTRKILNQRAGFVPPRWTWRLGQAVRIPEYNESEPDIAIVRGTDDDYKHRFPEPADVALLVEVSEFAPDREHDEKITAYAQAGISEYWIVNLVEGQVEVYAGPTPVGYRSRQVFKAGQNVPVIIDGHEVGRIHVADILP
jgi:Uma2 family endonuclease